MLLGTFLGSGDVVGVNSRRHGRDIDVLLVGEVGVDLDAGLGPHLHAAATGAVCVDDANAEHMRLAKLELDPTDVKEFYRDDSLMARFFF